MIDRLWEFLYESKLQGLGTPLVTDTAGRAELATLFAWLDYRDGAEIGVWQAEFSAALCQRIPGLHLRCVDPWQQYRDYKEKKNSQARLDAAYAATVQRLQPFTCDIWRMTSLTAAAKVPDASLDFVYIDANHEEPFISQDLEAWAPKVRSGGIVAGHDYFDAPKNPIHQQVKPAVDRYAADHGIAQWYVLAADKAPSWFWVAP